MRTEKLMAVQEEGEQCEVGKIGYLRNRAVERLWPGKQKKCR